MNSFQKISMNGREHLLLIIRGHKLTPVFQPIMAMNQGQFFGFEGLIRGPADSPLHFPDDLFDAALKYDLLLELETQCLVQVMQNFITLGLPGKLFANISHYALVNGVLTDPVFTDLLTTSSPLFGRIVFELTEKLPKVEHAQISLAVKRLREQGFAVALDDLGAGLSGLRLWSELRPEFVKIDQHFIAGINENKVNVEFVRAMKHIASESSSTLIAEGIETQAEFLVLKQLKICYAQGYFIGQAVAQPAHTASEVVLDCAQCMQVNTVETKCSGLRQTPRAGELLIESPTIGIASTNEQAYRYFIADPELALLPVLAHHIPVGVIKRTIVDLFSKPYMRELYAGQACTELMQKQFIVAEVDMPIVSLSQLILAQGKQCFNDGFVLTQQGKYCGVGTNFTLMQAMTRLQIQEARHANPLTLLPGNVPINEKINALLDSQVSFYACYVDLDYFKPFNDAFGYAHGDEVIKLTASILSALVDQNQDFVGHIGGDDFFILFQSHDWEQRCRRILREFNVALTQYVLQHQLGSYTYQTEDRNGKKTDYYFPSVSVGVAPVIAGRYQYCHQVAAVAAEVKKAAKKTAGSSLYVDGRTWSEAMELAVYI